MLLIITSEEQNAAANMPNRTCKESKYFLYLPTRLPTIGLTIMPEDSSNIP